TSSPHHPAGALRARGRGPVRFGPPRPTWDTPRTAGTPNTDPIRLSPEPPGTPRRSPAARGRALAPRGGQPADPPRRRRGDPRRWGGDARRSRGAGAIGGGGMGAH